MFKKTRLRIFGLIMAVATVIITLMLSIIYIANARYSFERGISLLESYMENNGPRPDTGSAPNAPVAPDASDVPDRHGQRPGMRDTHNRMFSLSTFYSVFYNQSGEAIKIDCDGGVLYSEQEILQIADSILSGGKTSGIYSKMPFLVKSGVGGTIVALIDNTMETDNSSRLFIYSCLVGIAGWIVILILAWSFSKKIVNPLEQNDKKQKQFISDAGHELKTPISVISANAELLAAELGENKWLANIQYENERMGDLVKQLLELVRAENMEQSRERLDFSRLVAGGALPFESVAFENGFTLHTDIEEGIVVDGNRNQLSQLVSILVDNALSHGESSHGESSHGESSHGESSHGERKGSVDIKLSSAKHQAILSVTNPGQPIPEEERDRLFERFYRADEARTEEEGHYGLGLAIAKAVVTAHDGKIELNCYDGLVEFKVILPKV